MSTKERFEEFQKTRKFVNTSPLTEILVSTGQWVAWQEADRQRRERDIEIIEKYREASGRNTICNFLIKAIQEDE